MCAQRQKIKNTVADTTKEQVDHQRLTSLINSMADAVIAVDKNARVQLYNGAALNLLDVNTITPRSSFSSLVQLIDKNNHPVDIAVLIKQTHSAYSNRDFRIVYADKSKINIYISIAPVHIGYAEKEDQGYVLMLRDITREKSLEEERDEFISVVSHELRTPITICEGNISNAQFTAERTGDISVIKSALKEAHDQVLFLSSMINDLSTLSRAERGKLQVEIEPINMHDLCNELAQNYMPEVESHGLRFELELDPHLTLLYSSKLYVREVLQNFLTNAIKYTEKGHITLGAKAIPDGVECYVTDTGIGISKGDQERVFDKFFRSEDYRTRRSNGTGLGLYVTMKLARLLHAEIEVTSSLDSGSTFAIHLPNMR